MTVVFMYGCAANPLASIDEPCPSCGALLAADTAAPTPEQLRLAEASLAGEALAWWRSLCTVHCGICEWIGSAFREERRAA